MHNFILPTLIVEVAMSAVGQTSGKPPTVKSTRKPPKAPRELQMPHPQDLSSKFKPEEISSKEDEKESPSVSETTSKSPIKKNAEIEEPEKKLNLKKVQPPANSKKLLNSEKQLLKTKNKLQSRGSKLKVNGKDKVKARERKENLLVLGNVSFEESGEGESSSEFEGEEDDDQADVHDKPIETIGDLLQIFGGKIEEELDNELHIRVPNSDNVVKVPKNIFTGLCAKCSQVEVVVSDLVAPDVGLTKLPLNNVNTQVPKLSHYDKSPILHSSMY